MEENVPLETESRKKFKKTVKGIKKMLKKSKDKPVKRIEIKSSVGNQNTPLTRDRGVVYIGHIPHGFYEDQMQLYFKQFGKVTNARVARSKKNGKSKGYAFVEFQNKEVAEIVAETMNNYLMDKRLLKAEYIPPDKQRSTFFSGEKWIAGKKCPGIDNRNKAVKKHNRPIADKIWISDAKQQLKKLYVMKAKLRTMGIDYDFFQPCDIPEELADFQPFKDAQPPTPNKDGEVAAKKKKPSTAPVTKASPSPKKNKKQKRKEKSMNKPVSPIVKPPKKKRMVENGQTGPSMRPLLTTKLDEVIVEKKSKKNKANKSPEAVAAQITASKILAAKVTAPEKSPKVAPVKKANPELKKKTGPSVRPLLTTKLDEVIVEKKSKKNKANKSPEAVAAQITAAKGTAKVTAPKKSPKVVPVKTASPELKKKVKKEKKADKK